MSIDAPLSPHLKQNRTSKAAREKALLNHLDWIEQYEQSADEGLIADLQQENQRLHSCLEQTRQSSEKLRRKLKLQARGERSLGVVTEASFEGDRLHATVSLGEAQYRVPVHIRVDAADLKIGAWGRLSPGRNCLLDLCGGPLWSEAAVFQRRIGSHQVMLLHHGKPLVALIGGELGCQDLQFGDLVGFLKATPPVATVRLEAASQEEGLFEEAGSDRFIDLAGLDDQIAVIKRFVRFRLQNPELAARYKLAEQHGILLEGPPGNGKTKLARCLAGYLADLSTEKRCNFMAISGSSDYSMWLGQSEQNIITRFTAARERAEKSNLPVVMFFDEIDALGRQRQGDATTAAPERILATLLAQLDGVRKVKNLVVIGATNRADLLDAALLRPGRLGDVRIHLGPPNRQTAREMLKLHLAGLPTTLPADRLAEEVTSMLYGAGFRGEAAAKAIFQQGRQEAIFPADLVSGAMLEAVVRRAAEEAADRESLTGTPGIGRSDLLEALKQQVTSQAALLTRGNIRSHVPRLAREPEPLEVRSTAV